MEHRALITPRSCYGADLWNRIESLLTAEAPVPTHLVAGSLDVAESVMLAVLRSLELSGFVVSERRLGTRHEPGGYWWSLAPKARTPRVAGLRDTTRQALDVMAAGAALVRTDTGTWTPDPEPAGAAVVVDTAVARGLLVRHLVRIAAWDRQGGPVRLELTAPWQAGMAKPDAPSFRQDGLTLLQRQALACLDEARSVVELAAAIGKQPASARSIVSVLVRRGLIREEGTRPRKAVRYVLVPDAPRPARGPLQERMLSLLETPVTVPALHAATGSDASYLRALLKRWEAAGVVRRVVETVPGGGTLYRRLPRSGPPDP
jgi:predicted transcriptional regulator